jgi:hypothetical protein
MPEPRATECKNGPARLAESLDRRDHGLVWNAALETGGVLVGEKVEIAIELEAVKKAAAAPVAA